MLHLVRVVLLNLLQTRTTIFNICISSKIIPGYLCKLNSPCILNPQLRVMKKILCFSALLCILLISCQQTDKKINLLLNKAQLPSQLFTIDINKDTTLKTANGAFITIPQGSLTGASSSSVQLQIKEAYSMEQIILAGLTTQSNGKPLSSGGMIYINAIDQSVKISKAIAVKLPTTFIDKRMQLFKGDTDANGKINWVKPDSLPANAQTMALEAGRQLFMNNCASCHAIGKISTGPDLAHILARSPNKKLLYEYTRNNQLIMTHGEDPYYRCLYAHWNKTQMNTFTSLTDKDLDYLYSYIENESKVRNLPVPKDDIRPCIDSCIMYWKIKNRLEDIKYKLSNDKVDMVVKEVINQATSSADNYIPDTITPQITTQLIDPIKKVQPVYNQSLYYQFNIQTFGWYNIDHLLDAQNAVECNLTVTVGGQYKENINLYLVIPSEKIFTDGGLLDGKKNTYGFYTSDGKIHLPLNTKAYVFAIGEFEDKIIFAKQEFLIVQNQDFEMSLSPVTKDFFNNSIKDLNLANMSFSVKETKNADTLRQIIKELKDVEKIKPVHCNCDCIINPPGAPTEFQDWENSHTDTSIFKNKDLFKK